jgi:Carboxypeptidase regulatory-like domain
MAQAPPRFWERHLHREHVLRWLRGEPLQCLGLGLLAFFLLIQSGFAQSSTGGSVGGTVVDAFGGLVVNARVEARNQAGGVLRWTRTDQQGEFRFAALDPGQYRVEVSGPGFAPAGADCTVAVGRVTELHLSLYAGGPHEAVTVNAKVQELDATSSSVASNLDQASLEALPSNGRRWCDFALLTPGAVPDQDGNGLISFHGTSPLLNNSVLDGADNNQAFFSEERGRTRIAYSISKSAVQEFQVNASNYSAEYGRAAGGVVNTVTRSGGNTFHGQLFYFDRSSNWAARNPFTTLTSKTAFGTYETVPYKPREMRYQGGVSVGGPIKKDKLFWFFSWDENYRDFPGVARALHPDALFAIPSTASLQMLGARTRTTTDQARENYSATLDKLASQLGVVDRTSNQAVFFPKIDWQIGERNHVTLQYNHVRWNSPAGVQTAPSSTYGITSFGNDGTTVSWIIGRWNFFLTPDMVNEVRYQYGRDFQSEMSQQPTPFEQTFATNQWGQPPQISVSSSTNGFIFGKPAYLDRIAYPDERRNQLMDTVTWVHGNHVTKLGYDYNHVNDYSNTLRNQTGTYSYPNVLNFTSDLVSPNHCDTAGTGLGNLPCYSWYSQSIGPTTFEFSSADYAGFLSEEWKVTRGLTLSFGIRYEYEQLPNTQKALVNPDFPQTATLPDDRNNIGPRFGFAWNLFPSGNTVLRGGYGVYYGRIVNSTAFAALTSTGSPNAQRSYYFRPTDVGPPPFPYVFTTAPPTSIAPDAVFFDTHFQNPQIQQAELSLEQSLGRTTTLSISGLLSLGRELPNFVDGNIDLNQVDSITYQVTDDTGRGPIKSSTYTAPFFAKRLKPNYQQVTNIFSETNSRYEAGLIRLTHRMQHGIQYHANYTYSHSTDYNQNESTFADGNDVLDPRNFSLEYGNSSFDVRQRLTGGAVFQSEWKPKGLKGVFLAGYSLAPTMQLQAGLPYTMRTVGAVPSVKVIDELSRIRTISGLGVSINGSGGDNRLPEVGRNTFRYPPTYGFDVRASKRTQINERFNLELLAECFNLINHRNATRVETSGYAMNGASSAFTLPRLTYVADFGAITNANSTAMSRERQIQIAVKLNF